MPKQTIKHFIDKAKEGTYYAFEVPINDDYETMIISYTYPKVNLDSKEINVVDLGIENSEGKFVGWSGSAHKSITVGEYQSSAGYLSQKITPGNWRIIVGAYKIPDGGITVTYEIELIKSTPRWLVGDIHMHSTVSDGQHDIGKLIEKAKKIGLDFIAVSDHNNYSHNLSLPINTGITLIPAVEWTHYQGHMNFYGLTVPFANSFIANNVKERDAIINYVKQHHGIVSVNHPKCSLCPYLWEADDYDMMEIWNGPMTKRNVLAITQWTQLLKQGRHLPAVGGSDYHRDYRLVRFAHPVNIVYSQSRNAQDILEALASGKNYITASIKGVRMQVTCQGKTFGESVKINEKAEVHYQISHMKWYHQLIVVTNDKTIPIKTQLNQGQLSGVIQLEQETFVYFKVIIKIFSYELIRAISNPIYLTKE